MPLVYFALNMLKFESKGTQFGPREEEGNRFRLVEVLLCYSAVTQGKVTNKKCQVEEQKTMEHMKLLVLWCNYSYKEGQRMRKIPVRTVFNNQSDFYSPLQGPKARSIEPIIHPPHSYWWW